MASGEIDIYGPLRAKTGEGKVAFASQIYDEGQGKFQSEINQEGGGGSEDAVLYTPQTLTNNQKTQARNNIGAASTDSAYTKSETQQIVQDIYDNVNRELGNKQDVLESGVNIKTVNNQSVLGSGNIEIGGGGSTDAVLFTPQTLTDEQKGQARSNINAIGIGDRVPSSDIYDGTLGNSQDNLNQKFYKDFYFLGNFNVSSGGEDAAYNIAATQGQDAPTFMYYTVTSNNRTALVFNHWLGTVGLSKKISQYLLLDGSIFCRTLELINNRWTKPNWVRGIDGGLLRDLSISISKIRSTDIDNTPTQGSDNLVKSSGVFDAINVLSEAAADYFNGGSYNRNTHNIELKHDGVVKVQIDATDFIKDGMVSNATVDSTHKTIIITFNTDAGKEDIEISVLDLFSNDSAAWKNAAVAGSSAWGWAGDTAVPTVAAVEEYTYSQTQANTKFVPVTAKTFSEAQKAQARANIGAGDEAQSNKVTTIGSSSTDVQYPSAKAVYTAISNAKTEVEYSIDGKYKLLTPVENSEGHFMITPLGVNYVTESVNTAIIVIDEGSNEKQYGSNYDPDMGWLYTVIFKTGSTPNITFEFEIAGDKTIVYPDDFSIEANRLYELSIMYVGLDVITNVKTYLLRIVDYTIPEITNGGSND